MSKRKFLYLHWGW